MRGSRGQSGLARPPWEVYIWAKTWTCWGVRHSGVWMVGTSGQTSQAEACWVLEEHPRVSGMNRPVGRGERWRWEMKAEVARRARGLLLGLGYSEWDSVLCPGRILSRAMRGPSFCLSRTTVPALLGMTSLHEGGTAVIWTRDGGSNNGNCGDRSGQILDVFWMESQWGLLTQWNTSFQLFRINMGEGGFLFNDYYSFQTLKANFVFSSKNSNFLSRCIFWAGRELQVAPSERENVSVF